MYAFFSVIEFNHFEIEKENKQMKRIRILLLSLLMIFCVTAPSFAVNIHVNNNKLVLDVDPQIEKGRTLVPVASISRALNGTVSWDPKLETVTINKDDKTIKLKLNDNKAYVNNKLVLLDVPAKSIKGRTMVPISFISSSFGEDVKWDELTSSVLINSSLQGSASDFGSVPVFAPTSALETTVLRVVDGDTVEIELNRIKEKVRLIGVDTPESVHPDKTKNIEFGKISSKFTKDYLEGKKVVLEYDVQQRDKYGRLLAYLYINNKMFNQILLEEGMAKIATYPPNVKYVDTFKEIEKKAREENKGLWAISNEETSKNSPAKPVIVPTKPVTPKVNPAVTPKNPTPVVKSDSSNSKADANKDGVLIKGNKNSKIFHLPGGRYYDKVGAENIVWFDTKEEAIAAGYRQAKFR